MSGGPWDRMMENAKILRPEVGAAIFRRGCNEGARRSDPEHSCSSLREEPMILALITRNGFDVREIRNLHIPVREMRDDLKNATHRFDVAA